MSTVDRSEVDTLSAKGGTPMKRTLIIVLALLVISILVMPAYMLATLLFTEILLPRLTFQATLLTLAASALLSWALHEASKRILAEAMRIWDLAS